MVTTKTRTPNKIDFLFPRPQQVIKKKDRLNLSGNVSIFLLSSPKQLSNTAKYLQRKLTENNIDSKIESSFSPHLEVPESNVIKLKIDKQLFSRPESYRLFIDNSGITIISADDAGLFYAIKTLSQLIKLYKKNSTDTSVVLPNLIIDDWPDFSHRGVMLDVSRDKVPRMQTLFGLIELLSSWKINQVQLYMEHTFAYAGHEKVWQDASPFTAEEIIQLDMYCRERHIDLVPNQNSFGHFHRWLSHDPYRGLAEVPEGLEHVFSLEKEPFSLCPTDPRSIELLTDLYNQLLPHFSSQQFNVGLDETWDLGKGRSKEICAKKGRGQIYLEFLQKIHILVAERDLIMQYWADIVFNYPPLIPKLPKDAITLIWGYEAGHPFDKLSKIMNENGLPFYVCPGTSSWNSFAGRTQNAIENLRNAAINGKKFNALGYLNTDWGDHGHLQPLPISYLGFLIGAGLAWNANVDEDSENWLDIPALLNFHVFNDKAGVMGKIAYDLGNAYREIGFSIANHSALFVILIFMNRFISKTILDEINLEHFGIRGVNKAEAINRSFSDLLLRELNLENLEKTQQYIDDAMKPLKNADMDRKDSDLIIKEFQWVAEMLKFACEFGVARINVGIDTPINELPSETKSILANKLKILIDQHKQIWLERNRPGGLSNSIAYLSRIKSLLDNE
ncbi:MAG: family 20 glycosylhydrolase [Promethearchaeota archaeon]